MKKTKIIALWLGIAAVCASVAFPPYGYEQYEMSTIIVGLENKDSIHYVPWTYVGHAFIFGSAPRAEVDQIERGAGEGGLLMHTVKARVRISWTILVLQIMLIGLVTLGVFTSSKILSCHRQSVEKPP